MTANAKDIAETRTGTRLERGLGPWDATAIVVGSMIGSGIFITPAESCRLVGAPGLLVVAWALAGVVTVSGALCCAELAAMMPQAGGQYVFFRQAYGRLFAFLYGWSLLLVIQTGTIAAVAVAFASFLGVVWPAISSEVYLVSPVVYGPYAVSLSTQQLVAIAVVLGLSALNARGLRTGKLVQNTFTIAKTSALAALICVALTAGRRPEAAAFASDWWDPWRNGWTRAGELAWLPAWAALAALFLKATVGPFFSQSAWNNVTFTGAEVREPGRNLPRALLVGCGVVAALYVCANVGYVVTLSLNEIEHAPGDRVAAAAMRAVFGPPGGMAMAVVIMISTFGCVNGLVLAGARVLYAMAGDGLLPAAIARVNRRHVPGVALAVQAVWAAILILPRTVTTDAGSGRLVYGGVYKQLIEYVIAAELVFYCLMVAAVMVLRHRQAEAPRPYRTWGYPWTPALYLVVALLIGVDLTYLEPWTAGAGCLVVASGVPAYALGRLTARKMPARAPVAD